MAVGVTEDGTPVAAAVPADADGVSVEPVMRYDATRPLGHVTFSTAPAAGGSTSTPTRWPTPGTWRRR